MILTLYRLLAPLLAALLPLAARRSPKLAATLAWRRERPVRSSELAALRRKPHRYWLHAASAGELEQALPLLAALRTRSGSAVLLTISSPSARKAAEGLEGKDVDLLLPLPADTPRAMAAILEALAPEVLILVKWDLWPNLLYEARRHGVPNLLLGGVLGADSGRARWPGRLLARPVFELLSAVGAAGERDASAFAALGLPPERLSVTGDTRFDRVLARRAEKRAGPFPDAPPARPRCLVAGSSWPPEEEMLLAAFAELREGHPDAALLLVPHEPGQEHLELLRARAREACLPLWTLSERAKIAAGGICVVDRVGILPELYGLGDVALVGGGFGAGIHSVLEPAAHGLPVLLGPRIGRADEARRLIEAGGGFVFHSGEELSALWRRYLSSPAAAVEDGDRAADFVAAEAGAVERSLALLDRILARQTGSSRP